MDSGNNDLTPSQMNTADSTASSLNFIKKQGFDREVKQLIKQSEETIQSRYSHLFELGETRPEMTALKRYLNIYTSMKPEEHYCFFETFYNRNRIDILNCLKSDKWIKNGKLVIQFGEGIQGLSEKCKDRKIMLSDIYVIACDLQETAEKSIDGIDEKFANDIKEKDFIRPNILLLHLMRIFYYLNDGIDKVQLGEIVSKLEDDLGIQSDRKTVVKSQLQTTSDGDGEEGLSSIFTMAINMMEKMGIKPPPNMKTPTNKEISQVVSRVFNNDATQGAIEKMFSSLQGCTDFSSAVQTVVKNVTDPETMGAIQESVIQTAQIASQMPSSMPMSMPMSSNTPSNMPSHMSSHMPSDHMPFNQSNQ